MTTIPKDKPQVTKLDFTKDDQEYIDAMLQGKPTADMIMEWSEKGLDIEHRTKHYTCPVYKERLRILQQKYKVGNCLICSKFPAYRVIYPMDGVILVQHFCQDHVPTDLVNENGE